MRTIRKAAALLPALAVLCAVLMICPEASALKKGRLYWLPEYYDNAVFYQVSTIPEGLKPYISEIDSAISDPDGGSETVRLSHREIRIRREGTGGYAGIQR